MSIQAVSRSRHGALRWRRYTDYRFAAGTALAPLAAAEIAQASLAFPLAFVERGGHWSLNVVLGLLPGHNLFVGPDGAWLGGYVPASFRGYPFLIGVQADGAPTFCVDEGSGLVTDASEGEDFFDAEGQLSPLAGQVLAFLRGTAESEDLAGHACDRLAAAGALEPWPITIQTDAGPQALTGLHRTSEAALAAMEAGAFAALRAGGSLALAYAQALSTANLPRLGQLAQAHAQARNQAQAQADAEAARAQAAPLLELPLNSDATWDWSKIGR